MINVSRKTTATQTRIVWFKFSIILCTWNITSILSKINVSPYSRLTACILPETYCKNIARGLHVSANR